jgi:glycosyltransferase involved in cell wall biosynthesis
MQNMIKPLNILMITHHRLTRASTRSRVIGRYLVERGHKVTVIVTAQHRRFGIVESTQDGVRIIEAPDLLWNKLRSGWDIWSLLNRIAYLSKEEPDYDLVQCFETRPATIHPANYFVSKHNLPLLSDWMDWWGHGGIIDVLRPSWYRLLFGRFETYYEEAFRPMCDGITTISTGLIRRAEGLGISSDRLYYLPGGTIPENHVVRSKEECRARFGLPLDAPMLAFVSADSYLDMDLIMGSLRIVAQKFPTVKLILTGHVLPSVVKLAVKYGVEPYIQQIGFVPHEDLTWWLGCADVCLLPFPNTVYNIGRWPNKVGHYMSLERPIVTNPYGDIKGLIEEHKVGLAADVTLEDFASKILLLLENPDLARQLGRNGRRAVESTYNWKTLVVGLEGFYARILSMDRIPRHQKRKFWQ